MGDIVQELRSVVEDLEYASETTEPFDVVTWPEPGPLTEDRLRTLGDHPRRAKVRECPLDSFFAPLIADRAWHDAHDTVTVRKFRRLLHLMQTRLIETTVFRVGEIELTIYVVGRRPDGTWVGVRTEAVET